MEKTSSGVLDKSALQKELAPLYLELFQKCQQDGIAIRKSENANDRNAHTCVPMFVGTEYVVGGRNSILIVGRAVNGWDVEWPVDVNEMVNKGLNQSFDLDGIYNLPEQDGYYFSKSRFFLVIKEMMKRLGANDEDWSKKFAWSNLYKIAPSVDGNPSGKVQHSQREIAIQILKKEIELLRPVYIVFVTGYDFTTWSWRNNTSENTFKKAFDIQPINSLGKYVEGYAFYNGSKIIVACRPEMKSVSDWTEAVINGLKIDRK